VKRGFVIAGARSVRFDFAVSKDDELESTLGHYVGVTVRYSLSFQTSTQ
jgi:hypothetical protein